MNISSHVYCLWAKIKLTSYKTENVGLISFGPFWHYYILLEAVEDEEVPHHVLTSFFIFIIRRFFPLPIFFYMLYEIPL